MSENLELPNNWAVERLGNVVEFEYGKGLIKASRNENGEYDVYGSNGVVGKHTNYLIKDPCVIIGRKGAAGEVHIATKPCWPIDTTYFVRGSKLFNLNYLYYQLKNLRLVTLEKSTAIPGLNRNDAYGKRISIPPLREQYRIVAKIEELFSELDKGVEALKTAQKQLKVYRQAVLKWAFEGKLTEEWRSQQKDLPTAAQLLEQIKKEREKQAKASGKRLKPVVPLTEEELAELPGLSLGWCWVKNEEYLFEVKDGTHDTPKYIEGGIPFITQKNIREKGLDFSDIEYISEENHKKFYHRSDVTKGDIIISMIGHNRGMSAIVETDKVFSIKNVGLFKFFSNLQSNKFSFYYYQSRIGLNIILAKSKGGAQQFIGLTELRNWPVPVCTIEEQHQIVAEIETRLSVADKLEETISQSLQQAEALRQSILKKAFAGKLVPQDPNDEPADRLLTRIRAAKAAQTPENGTVRRKGAGRKAASSLSVAVGKP